jgi:hypothetical protein
MLNKNWKNNIVLLNEEIKEIPVDAFEIQMQIYGHYKVLLEYEIETFALKVWVGEKFEYLDKYSKDNIFYGFDSMQPEKIQHNFDVLDRILKSFKECD